MYMYNLSDTLGLIDRGRPLFKRGVSSDTEYTVDNNREQNRENNEFNAQQAELNRTFNAEQAQLDRAFQQDIMSQQMQWNEDMWNKQNEYNTPSAQLERAAVAGINPNAIFGNMNSAAQAVGSVGTPSGASASGTAASAGSGAGIASGQNKFQQVLSALQTVMKDGSTVADMLYGLPKQKAEARLTNAEAKSQEIENKRKESFDDTLRRGFAVNSKTGEIKLSSQVGKDDIDFEPIIRPDSYNKGSLDAQRALSDSLAGFSEDQVRRFKASFEALVQQQLPNVTVKIHGRDVPAAEAVARLQPQTLVTLVGEVDKMSAEIKKFNQDVNTSKSEEEVNKEMLTQLQSSNAGDTRFTKAIDDIRENGLGWNALNVITGFVSDAIAPSAEAGANISKIFRKR